MNLSDFDYFLPPERIAVEPSRPRDSARLLHVARDSLQDYRISDLPDLLRPGDCLVVNDTKVIPARLTGRRGNAHIGITLDRPMPDRTWRVLLRNARRARPGDTIAIDGPDSFTAKVITRFDDGSAQLRFNRDDADFEAALSSSGVLALPPYIPRDHGLTPQDAADYQTIFAKHPGAVAAPTAGLHFSPTLLTRLEEKSIGIARVTLHVGAGTFLPVRTDDISAHRIHAEYGVIGAEAAARVNTARAQGGRIIAVGTTSLRLLESAVDRDGKISEFDGETDIFLRPGVQIRSADLLLTNFHLPRSTLLMLVAAFAGLDRIHSAYSHAIRENYRFYSYGDATLLERAF